MQESCEKQLKHIYFTQNFHKFTTAKFITKINLMKFSFLLISLIFIGLFKSLHAQNDVNLFNYWKYYSDAENSLYKYFGSVAFEQLDKREVEIAKLKTKADWQKRETLVRDKLMDLVGPFPEKTPLNAQITGVIQKDGYRVEKIIFESMPKYYVTAALFIPDNISDKAPAILNAIGHSTQSFRRDIYQHVILNLVKKGFIVFAYDQIGQGERLQYYNDELGKSKFHSTTEHSYPGAQCFISGYSPARYFIWDGVRAIDYLLSRQEVDPNRIGMTGLSGGGTSTAFISAIDDRILAAAPSCFITNYKYLFKSVGPQDAEQNIFHLIAEGLDHPDFIELRAPQPTLIVGTTRDFFSIQGVRETYAEAKNAFRAFGKEENLQKSEGNYVHGFVKNNNEATYAFFQKYLNNPGDSTDEDVAVISENELQVTKTGQMLTSFNAETIYSVNKKIVEKQIASLQLKRTNADKHLSGLSEAIIKYSGFTFPKEFGNEIFSGRFVNEDYKLEKFIIPGSGDYMLPLALFIPLKNSKYEIVLLLHEKGKDYAANTDSLAKHLFANGYTVLLGDLPGIGELGPGYLKGDAYIDNVSYNLWFSGILTGKSIVGVRAEDIIRMTHFIKTTLSDYNSISAISVDGLGSELLHAAYFDRDIQKIGLIQPFLSFAEIAMEQNYKAPFVLSTVAGAIEEYDLPDLIAGLHPQKLFIANPLSAKGLIIENSENVETILDFPIKVYSENNVPENIKIIVQANEDKAFKELLLWLKS